MTRKRKRRPKGTPKKRPLRRSISLLGVVLPVLGQIAILVALPSCLSLPPMRDSVTIDDRLSDFPAGVGHDLRGNVTIRFDAYQHAFIEADREEDVPYAMGLVHAHLRLGQMELIRHAVWGRLSEIAGPIAVPVDKTLRAIDLPRAVPEMLETMPPETRAWLDRYVQGINAQITRLDASPAELRFFGVHEVRPWTVEDVLAVGRVVSTDVNWFRLFGRLGLVEDEAFSAYNERLWSWEDEGRASFTPGDGSGGPTALDALLEALVGNSRSGSNCWVVSGDRSSSGSALLASDPHVGMNLPPFWCFVGYRSPGGAAMGYGVAGVPVVLIGRNEHAAWSGTNMLSLSSILYDAEKIDTSTITTREETVRARWWFDQTAKIRETPLGPVISDGPLFKRFGAPEMVLNWRGHRASDELTAFLKVSKARSFEEFRGAFETYAVSGQNFLFADRDGNIGQVLAAAISPAAGRAARAGVLADPNDPALLWTDELGPLDLPFAFNPGTGFLISCNNTPTETEPDITLSGNSNDRFERIETLLQERTLHDLDSLAAIQLDSYSDDSLRAARLILVTAESEDAEIGRLPIARALRAWDGHYRIGSDGAVAYQRVARILAERAYSARYGGGIAGSLLRSIAVHDFLREDIESGEISSEDVLSAVREAGRGYDPTMTWGDIHRFRISHPFGNFPLVGREFRYGERPVSGSTTTVMKSANALTSEKHNVGFGANARFICEPADLDANRFVLLGGNDGWLGSENFADQVDMFLEGRMVTIPFSVSGVREHFAEAIELSPDSRGASGAGGR